MDHTNYTVETMISAKSIAARCEELAEDISHYFKDTDKLIVVGLLRGSFVFIADLARELKLPCEVDFLETSSYGNSTESSREVRILKDLRGEIEGRDVLVIEDIVDTVLERMGAVKEIILVGDYVHGNDSGKIEIFLIGEQLNMEYIAQLEEKIEKLIKRKISFYLANKFLSTQPHILLFNEKENR